MSDARWLDDAEGRAWLGYRRMRLLLDAQVSRELTADTGLSDPDYDVLSNLSEQPGDRMRLTALAARMLWSNSRMSHHVARMEQRGLVTREECDTDGRGTIVALTPAGLRAIRVAAPAHVASVRRHFIDLLSADELAALDSIATKVLDHLGEAR